MKKFSMLAALITLFALVFSGSAFADTNASGSAGASAFATTAPIQIIENAAPQLPYTRADVKTKIESYTAPTAPSTYGAVGPAGCPALEGASLALFFANGSKSSAIELPGCMGLQLASLLATLNIGEQGQITRKVANILEAQCDFPQYKGALNRMVFMLDNKRWSCGGEQPVTVSAAPAAPVANGYSSDPLIAERQRRAGR